MEQFSTKYGHFSSDGNEYIITDFKTPKPWVNVISNGKYGLVVSQMGGGFSWDTHSEFNRLNRWHQDLVQDNWGKYFYVKDNLTGDVWSPTWMPVKADLDFYQVVYGFGYAKFISEFKGIKINLTVFIPLNENFEIWNFSIENINNQKKSLSIFSYFEWCLGSSSDHHREFHKTFLETHFDSKLNCMTATKRLWEIPLGDRGHWNIEYPYLGFISCSKKISDFDGDKDSFIGQYGSLQNPVGLSAKSLSRRLGKWNDSIGTIKTTIEINPKETKIINFFIGIENNKAAISTSLKKFSSQKVIDSALFELKLFWHKMFDTLVIETPDKAMNLMVNKWLRYQAIAGRLWGRTAYYQQSGAFGFRDQLQDSLVFLPIDPKKTEDQIRLHARHQFEDGTVLHWWHPISETGLPTMMTDDLLWLPFILIQYIDETGNYKILSAKESYYDNKNKKDTLFDHSIAAIEKVFTRMSKRGLTLIGAGDWNDGLSAVGLEMKGESIWLTEFFYLILVRFSDLCKEVGKVELHKKYSKKAIELKKAFDKNAWDGEWFYRATKDDGKKIGSKTSPEGKIYLNPQTWSVISGIAEKSKQQKAMDAVTKYLLKKNGCLLLSPAYTKPDKMIGYLSRYAPGRRENGGVYTHAATWAVWAYALIKKNDFSFTAYKNLCPIYNGMNPDEYVAEPYVTPGNIDGSDSPNYGMGGWTWYTGSAAWYQKVIVDWILGIRASKDGLVIDPCIPDDWKEFSVKRLFRGTTYNILVIQTSKSKKQKKYTAVDGKKIEGNILPLSKNKEVKVEVYI
ncbi:MAG: glycosyl transferase family 36 [Ignavibacteriaceae bacterium]|nr:glycosyl transferase family 36 [Ignavibacterium sp.]MCC6254400.1 glycosyl transferase family 36 [Ignavibacteriaceae bacterium]HRN26735.1 glycosyl transferase family 36 [Ignavibacteriaceae bacterium]HRP93685.1 glycosyl transferase family 36 [Ignavibacteriaceae bacterium]HRQ54361.1 glycosyl transferase family 36 [Ignavibacteriaceae bacterium]